MDIFSFLTSLSICVGLPVSIVLIVYIASMYSDNKRAQILLKAIETNHNIDAGQLAKALQKPRKSRRDILNLRLLRGCMLSLMGLAISVEPLIKGFTSTTENSSAIDVLTLGGILLAVGISYLIVYFVTRKQVDDRQ